MVNFSIGDRVDIWWFGDARRNGVIIKETPTRFLVEFWNGEPKPRQVWRKKDERSPYCEAHYRLCRKPATWSRAA